MPPDRQTGALFAADDQLVLADQFTDVLETDRRFIDRHAMLLRHGIDQVRGRDTAGHAPFQLADPDQIIQQQGDDVVGLDITAVGIQDTETVGIAIGGKTELDIGIIFDQRDEIGDMRLGRLGRMSAKIGVEMIIDDGIGDAALAERFVQIAARGSVQRVERNLSQAADASKSTFCSRDFQVVAGRGSIDSSSPCRAGIIKRKLLVAACSQHRIGAPLDLTGGFRQRRTTPGWRKFDAVVFRRVMAGGKVDASGRTAPQDFVRNDRCGRITLAEIRFDAGPGQHTGGHLDKTLPHETGIAADHDPFFLFTASLDGIGNGLNNDLDVFEGEIVTQDTAPTGCSKGDLCHAAPPGDNKTSFVVLE